MPDRRRGQDSYRLRAYAAAHRESEDRQAGQQCNGRPMAGRRCTNIGSLVATSGQVGLHGSYDIGKSTSGLLTQAHAGEQSGLPSGAAVIRRSTRAAGRRGGDSSGNG